MMVAKRTARAQRTETINLARALIITGPDDVRTRFTGQTPAGLVAKLAALRPRPGSMVRYHTLLALRGAEAEPSCHMKSIRASQCHPPTGRWRPGGGDEQP